MELHGKVALITGGARMGETIAQALGARGCRIALTWRRSKVPALKTVSVLQSQGTTAAAFRCDVSQQVSIRATLDGIQRHFGRLDVIVHLASIYDRTSLEDKNLSNEWDVHMNANARSAFLLSAVAAPLMKRSGGGRVILISDWLSASGRPRYAQYSGYYISKTTVKAVTEALALELAPSIQVNAIAPGPILPPKEMSAKERKAVEQATPLRRWGGAEEIAKAVLFLVETDFVTGETLRVDGGRHLY